MNAPTKPAILAVSFGTSHEDTREKTIGAIEAAIKNAWPQLELRRAFTSPTILRILKNRDHIHVDSVLQGLERLLQDGFTHVLIQPTHVINGEEYDKMCQMAEPFAHRFQKLIIGMPLLTSSEDLHQTCLAVADRFSEEASPSLTSRDALILMGHGTSHYSDAVYAAMDYRFKKLGMTNIFVCTVEGYPSLNDVLPTLSAFQPEKVLLLPLMLVAGDHAKNDMGGDEPDSWKSILQKEGYCVECFFEGLGEFPKIREIYLDHVREKMKSLLS